MNINIAVVAQHGGIHDLLRSAMGRFPEATYVSRGKQHHALIIAGTGDWADPLTRDALQRRVHVLRLGPLIAKALNEAHRLMAFAEAEELVLTRGLYRAVMVQELAQRATARLGHATGVRIRWRERGAAAVDELLGEAVALARLFVGDAGGWEVPRSTSQAYDRRREVEDFTYDSTTQGSGESPAVSLDISRRTTSDALRLDIAWSGAAARLDLPPGQPGEVATSARGKLTIQEGGGSWSDTQLLTVESAYAALLEDFLTRIRLYRPEVEAGHRTAYVSARTFADRAIPPGVADAGWSASR